MVLSGFIDSLQIPSVDMGVEIKCLDWSVKRKVGEVGVSPGEGRETFTVSGTCHGPELLSAPEEVGGGELHVESAIPLMAYHGVQLLPIADTARQGEVTPTNRAGYS